MISRERDFLQIKDAVSSQLRLATSMALVAEGDSLALLRRVPDRSVSLILTDPPYHSTKKENIYGDTSFAEDQHYLEWIGEYAKEWHRILRQNGSLFCFCASSMSAQIEVMLSKTFNVLSHVVWTKPNDPGFDGWKGKMKKESLRQWYPHSERILFAEPAVEGNLHRSPFAQFLRDVRKEAGLTGHQLTALTGAHGKVNHGGAVSNWEAGRNTPSREQYAKICKAVIDTGKIKSMPPYEDAIRIFTMDGSKEFTDVWTFPSVRPYPGKHPAEKPAALLEHAIEATTFPDDIVLDCFGGSGSTAVAALRLNRRTVSVEIDPVLTEKIAARLKASFAAEADLLPQGRDERLPKQLPKRNSPQLALFSADA